MSSTASTSTASIDAQPAGSEHGRLLRGKQSVGDLIKLYVDTDAQLDTLEEQAKELRVKREGIKHAIKITLDADGVDRASAHGLTVSLREKWRAKYIPDLWQRVVAWAISEGHSQIVQRRLTDAAVMELVDNGVPLPEGLSVEPFTDLDVRRTK